MGWLPKTINTDGLDLTADQLQQLLSVDQEEMRHELDDAQSFLAQFGDRLPQAITSELEDTRKRLET
jgi:phosphoenolpyruvate carboxykinase (GTP)